MTPNLEYHVRLQNTQNKNVSVSHQGCLIPIPNNTFKNSEEISVKIKQPWPFRTLKTFLGFQFTN